MHEVEPSSETIDTDVLIVGAGPVGLCLAKFLGLYGVRTMVLERLDRIVDSPREADAAPHAETTDMLATAISFTVPKRASRHADPASMLVA